MKLRVLVILNDPISPLGRFADHLEEDGIVPTVYRPYTLEPPPLPARHDALIVLGGRMEVWDEDEFPWLRVEKELIREWVLVEDKPVLGICLGHQLLASVLGGTVKSAHCGEAEIGNVAISAAGKAHPIFAGFGSAQQAICWHASEVTELPPDAQHLASTHRCANTAFAFGAATVGLQYHVEADLSQIETWLETTEIASHLARVRGQHGETAVRREIENAEPELAAGSQRLYDNFIRLARARTAEIRNGGAIGSAKTMRSP